MDAGSVGGVSAARGHLARSAVSGRALVSVLIFVLSVVLSAFVARSAFAFEDYSSNIVYSNNTYPDVPPFGSRETPGWNYRTQNEICRYNNSGQDGVYYVNSNNIIVYDSGVKWTSCNTNTYARLYQNGYFIAGCYNAGTVDHSVWCEAWNYNP